MIKLLKKYGVELKLKKCDLFRLIEGQKDTFLEDGFAFKMTNEEEMFKYEVILNGIYNKTKIEGEYKRFVYETQDAIQYLNYEEKQKMFNSIISETLKNLKQGTYTITELSNPHYGYTVMATGSVKVKGGMKNTCTLGNQKQTGNLKIIKQDADSEKNLEGVSFKIKKN